VLLLVSFIVQRGVSEEEEEEEEEGGERRRVKTSSSEGVTTRVMAAVVGIIREGESEREKERGGVCVCVLFLRFLLAISALKMSSRMKKTGYGCSTVEWRACVLCCA
jgi:hypothetical protein